MMLAAPGVLWIARPAHCGSISASRWAASDGGGVGGRQELGGWTAAAGGERRQRATSNERRPEEHELGQRATFHGQRSGERRATSDEWRATATSNEVASDELRASSNVATSDAPTSGVVAGCGRRALGDEQRGARRQSLGRAQQADGADRNRGAVDRTTRCGGSTSASRWADNGRRTTGLGSPQRRRERRGENSFSDGNGRRPEAHELGQRATFNGQAVASDGDDPRAPQAPNDGRRATRALQTPSNAAMRDDSTSASTTHPEATRDDATRDEQVAGENNRAIVIFFCL
jgi:hypothetical protein